MMQLPSLFESTAAASRCTPHGPEQAEFTGAKGIWLSLVPSKVLRVEWKSPLR